MCLATNTNVIVFGLTQLGLKPRSFAYKASMLTITPPMWLYTIRNNLCVRNTHVFAHKKMRKLNNINLTFDSQFWLMYFLSICFFSGIRPDKHPIIRLSRSVCITKRPYTNDLTPISQILFNIYLVTFLLQSPSSSEVSREIMLWLCREIFKTIITYKVILYNYNILYCLQYTNVTSLLENSYALISRYQI